MLLIFNLEHMLKLQNETSRLSLQLLEVITLRVSLMCLQQAWLGSHTLVPRYISELFFFLSHVSWIFNFPLCFASSFVKQAAMQIYETKGAEVYTNGSAGHMNGAEYTRMREVAFEKNQSEPMVRHTCLVTHTQRMTCHANSSLSCRL